MSAILVRSTSTQFTREEHFECDSLEDLLLELKHQLSRYSPLGYGTQALASQDPKTLLFTLSIKRSKSCD